MATLVASSPFAAIQTRGLTYTANASGLINVTSLTDIQDLLAAGCVYASQAPSTGFTGQVVTSGASAVMTGNYVVVRKASGSATAITLPAFPSTWGTYTVKDGKGDCATNNITVSPASGTIDGAASYVMSIAYQAISFAFDGANWNIV